MSDRPRIGSLCSGYGGLDLAVLDVFGGSVAWHCEYEPPTLSNPKPADGAAKVLAARWPGVPNHGDLTTVDWTTVEPVDVLTAGFPCQDLSYAGKGAGIVPPRVVPAGEMDCGCRWADHNWRECRALPGSGTLGELRGLVASLNHRDLATGGPPPERTVEGNASGLWYQVARAVGVLRPRLVLLENVDAIVGRRPGLDVVMSSLAGLGFDADWCVVPASAVGAPHRRARWFCVARPAADAGGQRRDGWASVGGDGWGAAQWGQAGNHAGHGGTPCAPAGPDRSRRQVDGTEPGRPELPDALGGGRATADAAGDGRDERRPEPAGIIRGPDAPLSGHGATADADGFRYWLRADEGGAAGPRPWGLPGEPAPDAAWGPYGAAIRRWAAVLGHPAPAPTEPGRTGQPRLSPAFVEWMQGLPAGWVTDVPIPRNAQLKALGNGVVPQQAAAAYRMLLGLPVRVTTSGGALLPTPQTQPTTGNGHARDLSSEIRLLPTPDAGAFNDGESVESWTARRDAQRKLGRNGNGMGTPLAMAVRLLDDGTA